VISYWGSRPLETFAYRPADGVSTLGYGGDPGPFQGTVAYSDQLYGYNTKVCAYGRMQLYFAGNWSPWASYCA
jgi:hypothetical protein